ncbi:flagellar hook-length control protein FliK [Myxococcota bacterium]|nr:flagellar hook-length control protein FliK [Myxococcota bacterium]MCZ7617340.1 flagellar hook-length control protein FliK [Myxococcota bacterium]
MTSPLRPVQAGLVAPEPSPLEAARPIAPGDRERERPNVAPSLETGSASPAIRESTAPSSPTPAERTAPPPPTPSAAVVQQVEWLARQGGGTARMRLSPASLGEIEVQVELQQGRVAVVVRAREQAGQQALMTERAAITQLFAARDLRVADFIVTPMDGGMPAGDAGANGDSAASAGREHGLGAENRLRPDSQSASTRSTAAARGTADTGTNGSFGRLDVHV